MSDPATTPAPFVPDYATARAQFMAAEAALRPVRRVVRVAMFDAWTIAIFAAPTFICGLFGGITGVLLGGAMSVIAFVEFKGAAQLRRLDLTALDRLAKNQLALAGVLILYALWSLYSLHGGGLLAGAQREMPGLGLDAMGPDVQALDRSISLAVYDGLIVITLAAQGGMALYYFSRRKRLQQVIASMPAWAVEAQRNQTSTSSALNGNM